MDLTFTGTDRGSAEKPELTSPADRFGAAVNPELLVGAFSSVPRRGPGDPEPDEVGVLAPGPVTSHPASTFHLSDASGWCSPRSCNRPVAPNQRHGGVDGPTPRARYTLCRAARDMSMAWRDVAAHSHPRRSDEQPPEALRTATLLMTMNSPTEAPRRLTGHGIAPHNPRRIGWIRGSSLIRFSLSSGQVFDIRPVHQLDVMKTGQHSGIVREV